MKLEKLISESSENKSSLEKEREKKLVNIDESVLNRYTQISTAREGFAVVTLEGKACSGCGFVVPAQDVTDIRDKDFFYNCDVCSRFIYY